MNTSKKDMLNKEQLSQQQDSSSTQDRRESKYQKHEVEDTPFTVIEEPTGDYESDFIVTLGQYRMTQEGEHHKKLEDAMKDAKKITWGRIIQVAGILIQANQRIAEEKINNIEVVK